MALTTTLRARAYAIALGEHGADAAHTLASGRFHRAQVGLPLERVEASAIERAVQVSLGDPSALEGFRNPLVSRDLSTYPLTIRVGYLLTGEGDDAVDASGEASGAGHLDAIEDRAHMDLKALRECVGWQPSWAGLSPSVIDCGPEDPASSSRTILDDRVIYEQRFDLKTSAGAHASHAPAT